MDTDGIGARIRRYRQMRGLSLRTCADLAGLSRSMLSCVERGQRTLERRSHIDGLATALQMSPAELLGQPYEPADPERSATHSYLEGIRAALIGTELGESAGVEPWRTLTELERTVNSARARLYRYGDAPGAAREQYDVLLELHAWVSTGGDDERAQALRSLVVAACTASSTAKWMGHTDLAWGWAIRARHAARMLEDPAMTGLAEWRVSLATRPYEWSLPIGKRAIERLEPQAHGTGETAEVYGMLHLMSAMDCAVVGRADDSQAHLTAALAVAERTGNRNAFELYFGPTNATVWQMSIAVESGEGGKALRIARDFRPSDLPSKARRANWYQDLGRALAQAGRPREATYSLLEAERYNPVEIRNNPFARQLVLDLLSRVNRAAGGIELRSLGRRMGVIT